MSTGRPSTSLPFPLEPTPTTYRFKEPWTATLADNVRALGIQMVCAGGSGAIAKTAVAPLERVKVGWGAAGRPIAASQVRMSWRLTQLYPSCSDCSCMRLLRMLQHCCMCPCPGTCLHQEPTAGICMEQVAMSAVPQHTASASTGHIAAIQQPPMSNHQPQACSLLVCCRPWYGCCRSCCRCRQSTLLHQPSTGGCGMGCAGYLSRRAAGG